VLEAVFTQTLIPRSDGNGRVCAMEILVGTHGVRNLIRENKSAQMMNAIQTGSSAGMISLDKCLANFVSDGFITLDAAMEKSSHPEELRRLCSESAPKPRYASSF
jgi:twitching motility protein PilT